MQLTRGHYHYSEANQFSLVRLNYYLIDPSKMMPLA